MISKEQHRQAWDRRVSALLMEKFGVEPIGLDASMEAAFGQAEKPESYVDRVGREFKLAVLEGWRADHGGKA